VNGREGRRDDFALVAPDAAIRLPDGRRVAYRELGATGGRPLIALHGTPGSRLKFLAAHETAVDLGLRVIAPDRWGYGATDPHPAPSLAAFAADMGQLADALGLGRFSVLGVSGGGPYAVATAALHSTRVSALALAAPVGPIRGEVDAQISAFHRLCFGAFARRHAAVGALFGGFRRVLAVSPGLGMRLAMVRVARADREVLGRGDIAIRLAHTFIEGLRPGVQGPIIDMSLFGDVWDIDPGAAAAPAKLWLGTSDQNIPRSAARRLADRLPRCDLTEVPGAGHLWIAENYATVLGWIRSRSEDRE
jgi:pimeloyl-ACP methyl ester carboxylesterase